MSATPVPFHRRVEHALADARLRGALQRTTGRVLAARATALGAFPTADAVRDRARRIRARTLAELDRHLDRFVTAVEARGGHVHFAETAADAVEHVSRLARDRVLARAVKSKSMISEEIHLNDRLEREGVQVTETDLGEWIVQLGSDHPSHIVMPIIHLTRHDVARLLRERVGASEAELADVPAMTQLARRVLRQAFLDADLGVSGVNFGVAETGTICVCTNEGNGRLTTTVPRVHVAMMGIERIVPTLADLAVMLQVLGRSATGQALTVYTNLLTGPRRSGEPDGPEELHVVLLDNGRSRVLGSSLAESLYCIRCGACLNVCPVYQQIGGHAYGSVYPGPIGSVLTPALTDIRDTHDLPNASSLCGACREVCPVRIDLPRMLLELRATAVQAGTAPAWLGPGMAVLRFLGVHPSLFTRAGGLAAMLAGAAATNGWVRHLPGPLAGWTATRDFPAPARESFLERWRRTRTPARPLD